MLLTHGPVDSTHLGTALGSHSNIDLSVIPTRQETNIELPAVTQELSPHHHEDNNVESMVLTLANNQSSQMYKCKCGKECTRLDISNCV